MTPATSLYLWLAAALVGAAVVALLLRNRERIGVHALTIALAGGAIVAGLSGIGAVLLSPSLFFLVHVAYVELVVALPLAALLTLLLTWRRCTAAVRALACLGVVGPSAIGAYATFVEPFRLVSEHVTVPIAPSRAPLEPLRVAVLADIQTARVTDHHREAVRRAMAFEPHLVLLPGDLMQGDGETDPAAIDEFRALLRPLWAPLGVYFVMGNCDDRRLVPQMFEGTNVVLLDDAVEERFHAGRRVLVGGVRFSSLAGGKNAFVQAFDTPSAEAGSADTLRILVSHYPDAILGLDADPAIDLVVAGHTHGGQVQVPFFGPPITLSAVPRHIAAGGLHEHDGRLVYVSRGIGWEQGAAPRVRLFCPPEVSLLTLEPRRP
jgi:hypothetical protein